MRERERDSHPPPKEREESTVLLANSETLPGKLSSATTVRTEQLEHLTKHGHLKLLLRGAGALRVSIGSILGLHGLWVCWGAGLPKYFLSMFYGNNLLSDLFNYRNRRGLSKNNLGDWL